MLTPVEKHLSVVACNTCRLSAEQREDAGGVRGGALLVAALEAAKDADPRYADVAIEQMPCLFSCSEHCSVHLRAPGKVGYLLGRFVPDADAARAILDYAVAYAESEHGRVPFKLWPQAIKGHFIARIPPEGYLVDA
jgi:predicted metal-binding protein